MGALETIPYGSWCSSGFAQLLHLTSIFCYYGRHVLNPRKLSAMIQA